MRRRSRRVNADIDGKIRVRVVNIKRRKHFVFRWKAKHDGALKSFEQSSGIPAKRQLRQLAERKAVELERSLNNLGDGMDWDEFCKEFYQRHLSGLSAKSIEAWNTAEGLFKTAVNPNLMVDVTSETLSRFVRDLRRREVAETSIATYLRTIMVGLNWAAKMKFIPSAPEHNAPRRSRGVTKTMRSRPPTGEEYERLRMAVPLVRPGDAAEIDELINGLWLSGLRISEALDLTWDWSGRISIEFGGRYPTYLILAEGEKGHSDRLLPVAPEFAEWLAPRVKRRGRVFTTNLAQATLERIITRIGKRAGVVVNGAGKCVTAQDLRRAFGTRWSMRVRPAVLQLLMRHRTIDTTMKYYVHIDVQNLAEELWKHVPSGNCGGAAFSSTFDQIVKDLATVDTV